MINIALVKNMSSAKRYEKGEVIVRDGDTAGDEMYILLKGSVGIYKNYATVNEIQIATLSPGDFFGEMTLFLEKSRTASVVALTEAIAVSISRKNALNFFRREPETTFALIKSLCERIDSANLSYEKLYTQTYTRPDAVPEAKGAAIGSPDAESSQCEENAEMPEPDDAGAAALSSSGLFPEGHKTYRLALKNDHHEYLHEKSYTCPICGDTSKALAIKTSKLITEKTDADMRIRYKGIEPMYYDVVTCPKCFFSALAEQFKEAMKPKDLTEKLTPIRTELPLKFGMERDSFTVFAGYYLALFCAPFCFMRPEMITARLWAKLSRIYGDCGDENMEMFAAEQALKAYLYVYQKVGVSPGQNQQLYIMIGELSLKMGDLKSARNFFFQAKIDKQGTAVMKRHADNRIEDIRQLEAAAKMPQKADI